MEAELPQRESVSQTSPVVKSAMCPTQDEIQVACHYESFMYRYDVVKVTFLTTSHVTVHFFAYGDCALLP